MIEAATLNQQVAGFFFEAGINNSGGNCQPLSNQARFGASAGAGGDDDTGKEQHDAVFDAAGPMFAHEPALGRMHDDDAAGTDHHQPGSRPARVLAGDQQTAADDLDGINRPHHGDAIDKPLPSRNPAKRGIVPFAIRGMAYAMNSTAMTTRINSMARGTLRNGKLFMRTYFAGMEIEEIASQLNNYPIKITGTICRTVTKGG